MHMQQKQRMLLLTKKLNVMASFYPMYDFAVKVGGDCLMLIWQHFGKKEVSLIFSANQALLAARAGARNRPRGTPCRPSDGWPPEWSA